MKTTIFDIIADIIALLKWRVYAKTNKKHRGSAPAC